MKVSAPPEIRGMLGESGDSAEWLEAVANFPNGVRLSLVCTLILWFIKVLQHLTKGP
jgi:hypothetical protein